MKNGKYQKELTTPVMDVPEKSTPRIGDQQNSDRFVGMVNFVWDRQKNAGNDTNQKIGCGNGSKGIAEKDE